MSLSTFIGAYIECALWSSNDESTPSGGYPLDDNYGPEDLSPTAELEIQRECRDFYDAWGDAWEMAGLTDEQAGHDFWLTRNGHGAGFWDRGLGDIGQTLTDACRPYGESYIYVGDDGALHVS